MKKSSPKISPNKAKKKLKEDYYGDLKQEFNFNTTDQKKHSLVIFIDMNSFFTSCEQQVNFYLRNRPVGVCVYPGKFGCVIAVSPEAKKRGVKGGMRLNDAIKLCPELVPLETSPQRYREFHVKIIQVLKKYSSDVVPKSIDEAIVNLNDHTIGYNEALDIANKIKNDIKNEVGDWLKCSIGIAPNAFLAKLASDIKKPDGLTVISPENIDKILKKLKLTDLPGIAEGMSQRLIKGGILNPIDLRYANVDKLKIICKSIIGLHWHYRLNFAEIDMSGHNYKNMSAMRHVSSEQRKSLEILNDLLLSLCMTLEKRMVKRDVFAKKIYFTVKYIDGTRWDNSSNFSVPIQDGIDLLNAIKEKAGKYVGISSNENFINIRIDSLCVIVGDFIHKDLVQYSLFENNYKKDLLRQNIYEIKDKFGTNKLLKASQLSDESVLKDVIGFGSIKDLDSHIEDF
jgi:DNA polymerase-4